MHEIEFKIRSWLEEVAETPQELPEDLLEEFGEACKAVLIKQFATPPEEDFRLRISNIGRDVRQLWLQKEYGFNARKNPDFMLKMCYGDLTEALITFIMKASGVEIQEQNKEVELDVNGNKILGEYDIKVGDKIYDVKSASGWAYRNKMTDWGTINADDAFGYLTQIFDYAEAESQMLSTDIEVGGLIVFNKEAGDIRVIEPPAGEKYEQARNKAWNKTQYTVEFFNKGMEPDPCDETEPEYFRGKATGNTVLGDKCKFCSHKDKCHPGITLEENRCGNAKVKAMKWYIND